MSDEDGWTWQFRAPAKRAYDDLDGHARMRITDKLDEIVDDQWRNPDDYVEPLTGVPHSKLRIGQFRLGVRCSHNEKILDIYPIEHRSGAYKPGDD